MRQVYCGVGLVLMGSLLPLSAQTVFLPASDPVGIGRSGTGVAFGRSIEAASLNPALLATLTDRKSGYLAMGMDLASSQVTLSSNQRNLFSEDRNRALGAFGVAARIGDRWGVGLKMDSPFLRHAKLNPESAYRFKGSALDLDVKRLEAQVAYAITPAISVGATAGIARISYESAVSLRLPVPQALTPGSPALALMEVGAQQEGRANAFSWSLGWRWALNTRWTLAGVYQRSMKADLGLSADRGESPVRYYATNGYASAPLGSHLVGGAILAQAQYLPGSRTIVLPSRASMGVRHRMNQLFTWEVDLFRVASSMILPTQASIRTPYGSAVAAPMGQFRDGKTGHFGFRAMSEFSLFKNWTFRAGASLDPGLQDDSQVDPLLMAGRSAAFSAGASYALWGGELSAGYQFRQARDVDSQVVDGAWSLGGYRPTGSPVRVESMGHLWSIGFRRSF